jgi:hypothetical protein
MGTEFTLARRLALSLIFSCAGIACGQNASVLPPSGAGSMSSSSGSGGFGAVDYSSSASLPVISTDSSVANAGVSATPSALTASDLAASQAGGGSSAHQSAQHLGSSLSGGNQSPSATSASRSGSSRGGSLNGLRGAASASSNRSGARQSLHSGQGVAARESSLTGYRSGSSATGAKLSSGQAKAGLSEEVAARSVSGSAAGSGQYPTGFPDSTKNMAVISPPDLGNDSLFVFSPAVSEGFPDLANYQFLQPTFHVSGGGASQGGGRQKQDLYRRIERRLKEYREAETPKNNGLKTEKRSKSSDLDNPFGRKTSAEDKLNKLSNPDSSF